jgi:DNA-binding NarL/FixJ family response regulator
MDGIAPAHALRGAGAKVFIIYISDHGDPDPTNRIRALHPAGYLTKQILTKVLTLAVTIALRNRALSAERNGHVEGE